MTMTWTHRASLAAVLGLLATAPMQPAAMARQGKAEPLVYADFEAMKDGRPVSTRGGFIRLSSYAETQIRAPKLKGLASLAPPAPELVRLKPDDPNRAAAFDYEFQIPNKWEGAAIEVYGRGEREGHHLPDDVSGYKFVTLQVYTTGVNTFRIELVSHGQGIEMDAGYPQATFKVSPGFNTYKIKLDSLRQPGWAEQVSVKEVLRRLTTVVVTAYCEEVNMQRCEATKGTVVVDNITFAN